MRITSTILFISGVITILIGPGAFINPNFSRWIKNMWGDKGHA